LLKIVDRGNVLMIECGQRLGFALEPAHTVRIPRENSSGRILIATSRLSLASRAR
jgi:hypothetical protein